MDNKQALELLKDKEVVAALTGVLTAASSAVNYFGVERHEERVLRKFIGYWDQIMPYMTVEGKKQNKYLDKMVKLRSELR